MRFILLSTLFVGVLSQGCPKEGRAYFADSQQCDKYVQCKDGVATEELCPDGLLFKQYEDDRHPCVYPTEVDCGSRSRKQPAQPTQHCANQWGYGNSGDSSVCDKFYACADGQEYEYTCPEGLAFSSLTYRCEYPSDSPDCDVRAYLGFQCPDTPDEVQLRTVGTPRYASPRDCRKYFLCVGVSARIQSCENGLVFNPNIYGCDEPENVRGCEKYYPADELKAIRDEKARRAQYAAERQARLEAKIAELNRN